MLSLLRGDGEPSKEIAMPSLFHDPHTPGDRIPEGTTDSNRGSVTISAGAPLGLLLLAMLLAFGPARRPDTTLDGGTVFAAGLLAAGATYAALTLAELATRWRTRRLGLRADAVVVSAWGPSIPDAETPHTWQQARSLGRFKPLATLGSAGILLLLAVAALGAGWSPLAAALAGAASLAGALAVLDLLPGPARSGGLLVQARAWRRGDRGAGDVAVARTGIVTGWMLIGTGLVVVTFLGLAGLWIALVGWLTLLHSRFERVRAGLRSATAQLPSSAVMTSGVPEVAGWHTVETALTELGNTPFPVVPLRRFDGTLQAVAPADLFAVPPDDRDLRRAQDLARPAVLLAPSDSLEHLLEQGAGTATPLGIVVENARVVGIVGPVELARVVAGGSFGDSANPFSPSR
jgi:hypothetical protein